MPLGAFYICGSTFAAANGFTVGQILSDAEAVLGGAASGPLTGLSLSDLNTLCDDLNNAIDDCNSFGAFAQYLSPTSCSSSH